MDLSELERYSYKVHTYGCKVNTYDAGLLQRRMERAGWKPSLKPQVHILNTCAVTAEATKEAVRQVRRIKAKEPLSTVVVTGCSAQVDTEAFNDLPADLIVANSHKGFLENILDDFFAKKNDQRVFKSNIFRKNDLEAGGGIESEHTRAFLKIQDGCNSFCTYCVIPFGRGKSRSVPINDLVRRVNELHSLGHDEVVLTGVHIGDYEDGEKRLEDLVEAVLERTFVPRIRLTSLEPVELSQRLIDLYQDERMCRHFHMSIQSACSSVLKGMKRNYNALDVEESLNAIAEKVPGSFVGMDVIVGFPGETQEEFEETYSRLASLPWSRIHVFPYSERPGTKAILLEGKNRWEEIKRRAAQLRNLSHARFEEEAKKQVGTTKQVLVLNENSNRGLSRDYWSVELPENAAGEVGVQVQSAELLNGSWVLRP